MDFNASLTLYDILDLTPDATQHEVREAYLRTKSAYNKDSLALYTLIGSDEREEMLQKVEEAYSVLSSPERRKEYDKRHGVLEGQKELVTELAAGKAKVISIDRVPPMEASSEIEDILVAPATDFSAASEAPAASTSAPAASAPRAVEFNLAEETEWAGALLKKIRESRRISIEELVASTKISKTYLLAIEEENYAKLPAPVFVRGFLVQMARILKLPQEQVANAFLARLKKSRAD